jgi:hypothetical protein
MPSSADLGDSPLPPGGGTSTGVPRTPKKMHLSRFLRVYFQMSVLCAVGKAIAKNKEDER